MNNYPVFHDDAVASLHAVLIAWGPLCEKEQQLAEAMAAAVRVQWEEIAPPEQRAAGLLAAEGEVDGRGR